MSIWILHRPERGYGWSFASPDVRGLVGGTGDFDPAEAEQAARFALSYEAEDRGEPAASEVAFEHFAPASLSE